MYYKQISQILLSAGKYEIADNILFNYYVIIDQ